MATTPGIPISFIVPALNEQAVLESFIEQVLHVLHDRFRDYEVLLINDGSTDSTGAIMERLAEKHERVRVLHNERNIGWGASYQRGLREAQYDYVMLLCGDGGLPAHSLPSILDQIGKADIVIPYMTNLRKLKSTTRFIMSRGYTTLLNLLFGLHLRYYNGLPVHRRDLLQSITITSGGFGFQAEILIKLIKSGCTYVEVGVDGAEETNRSSAMRLKNWLSVGRTILHLVKDVASFSPISADIIARRHNSTTKKGNTVRQ